MLFVASKVFWIVAAPGNLLLLLLALGAALLFVGKRARRIGQGLVAAVALCWIAVALPPIGEWLALPLENRFPAPRLPERADGIIVLGGAVDEELTRLRGQPVLNDAAERLTETAVLARRYPNAAIVVSGGDNSMVPQPDAEADGMRELLVSLGVDPARVRVERRSRNTWENAVNSRALVAPSPGSTWLLVTSAMHMPRAVGCFREAGWPVLPVPVDYHTPPAGPSGVVKRNFAENLALLDTAAHEWAGLLAYRLLGRIPALFPGPESAVMAPILSGGPATAHEGAELDPENPSPAQRDREGPIAPAMGR